MADRVFLLIGTHKGGFLLESDVERKDWQLRGPFFAGNDVHHLTMDVRTGEPRMYAAVNSAWFGPGVRMSTDFGETWDEPETGPKFDEASGLTVEKVWQITPGGLTSPGVLFAGVEPAALFRSDDNGKTWSDVKGLTQHETRDKWAPGAGGLMLHSILPHPYDPRRMQIAISAAGTFETMDGGETWKPRNKDVKADFLPEEFPEVGQCVHHLEAHPSRPDLLYQQNHCGVYRSNTGGEQWSDIGEGLPSTFGFPILVHPFEDDTVYVVPMQGPEFRAAPEGAFAVYRSREREPWERLDNGLPHVDAYPTVYRQAMSADAIEDQAGIYLGTSAGEVYGSLDNGDSWVQLASELPTIYSVEAKVVAG
jgi:hypothetical protein